MRIDGHVELGYCCTITLNSLINHTLIIQAATKLWTFLLSCMTIRLVWLRLLLLFYCYTKSILLNMYLCYHFWIFPLFFSHYQKLLICHTQQSFSITPVQAFCNHAGHYFVFKKSLLGLMKLIFFCVWLFTLQPNNLKTYFTCRYLLLKVESLKCALFMQEANLNAFYM